MCEPKPPIISQQCVVYNYKCELCDAEYVGCTSRLLHQRIDEHRYSAIGKYLKNDHGPETIADLSNNFSLWKKWTRRLDCLIYEMFFIKKKRPCWNTQSDSIRHYLHAHFYAVLPPILSYQTFYSLQSLGNDDMESSKLCVKLRSLIFIIRCLTKSNLIKI